MCIYIYMYVCETSRTIVLCSSSVGNVISLDLSPYCNYLVLGVRKSGHSSAEHVHVSTHAQLINWCLVDQPDNRMINGPSG